MNITVGLLGFINNVSEADIERMVKKYRRKYPRSKRKDWQLRPLSVNQIINEKQGKK